MAKREPRTTSVSCTISAHNLAKALEGYLNWHDERGKHYITQATAIGAVLAYVTIELDAGRLDVDKLFKHIPKKD